LSVANDFPAARSERAAILSRDWMSIKPVRVGALPYK
jgi:hypothetical protein